MRNRHRVPSEILSTLILLALVLLRSSTASAQESARDRVSDLREHLAQVESTYAQSLADLPPHQPASVKLDHLRVDLRIKLKTLFDNSTSSEAVLAVYRADADSTLDAIRAYEQALGAGSGEETTFMNVLSDTELHTIRDLVHERVVMLKQQALPLPPKDLSSSLEFRIRELKGWEGSLDLEIARRNSVGQIQLRTVPADVTAENARLKYPAISKADGRGSELNFKQRLALQVNSRLHTAPQDAALAVLRDRIPDIPSPTKPTQLTRGPPQSAEDALTKLSSTRFDELNAVNRRDTVAIAKSRARLNATREWFRLAQPNLQVTDGINLSETSTSDLIHLRKGWQKWYASLIIEQQQGPQSASLAAEIKEAQGQINELDARIERRLMIPPPEGGDFSTSTSGTDPPRSPSSPEIRAFNRDWNRRLAHEEVSELTKLSNNPRTLPEIEISKATTEALHTRIKAEAQTIRNSYDEIFRLRREVLISGRGQTAADAVEKIHEARKLIRSAAEDLRTFLADPRYANDPVVPEVLRSISDIPPSNSPPGATNLQRGLTALENAHDAVAIAREPRGIVIQGVSNSNAVGDPAFRINLPPPPNETANPVLKKPADYENLYRRRQTLPEMLKDPKRLPGGVVIDAKLPQDLANRLKGLEVNVDSGTIKVLLDNTWRTLTAKEDPSLARLAWAFVLDEQIAVIDLRPLDNTEAVWLGLQYVKRELPKGDREQAVMQLARLTSVNVNTALRDTPLVPQLIAADQLMFDLLPRSAASIEGEDTRYGLPLGELRRAFRDDAREMLNRPNWQDVLFNKSLLAVSQVSYQDSGPQLVVIPKFSFFLFGVTASDSNAISLTKSEQWFAANEGKLKALDQLKPLCEFATLVSVFRTVNEQRVPHNLDDLIAVPMAVSPAPRFIIRRDRIGDQNWQQLQAALSGREK
jgi:hypothetical protein